MEVELVLLPGMKFHPVTERLEALMVAKMMLRRSVVRSSSNVRLHRRFPRSKQIRKRRRAARTCFKCQLLVVTGDMLIESFSNESMRVGSEAFTKEACTLHSSGFGQRIWMLDFRSEQSHNLW